MYQEVVDRGLDLLEKNKKTVVDKFTKYYNDWLSAENLNRENRNSLKKLANARQFVGLFTSTTRTNSFDLRYHGAPFAILEVKEDKINIKSNVKCLTPGLISDKTIKELKAITLESEEDEK